MQIHLLSECRQKRGTAMKKTCLKGGIVVSGSGSRIADLLIEDEKIVRVDTDINDPDAEEIDCAGKYIFPGFIDAHTHFNLHVAGTVTSDNFETGTAAAIAGGTTLVIDFGTQYHGETLKEGLQNWHDMANENGPNSCDYSYHMSISEWNPRIRDEVDDMMEAGITTFKIYMTYPAMMLNDGEIYEVLKKLKEVHSFTGCHCENAPVIDALIKEQKELGNFGPSAHPRSRPDTMEAEAVHRLMVIAKEADAPIMVVHTTNEKALNEIIRARAEGVTAYSETCPQYLFLDKSLYDLPDFEGAKYICAPPLRTKHDQEVLWNAIKSGIIDTVCTDHCDFTLEQRKLGRDDFTKIPGGLPGVETRGDLMFSEGVGKGRISPECLCRVLSENQAKLYGVYPTKGALLPGSDADIAVIDPTRMKIITAKDWVTNCDNTPYEGMQLKGCVEKVFLRGNLCVDDGRLIRRGLGKFVKRGVPNYTHVEGKI